MNPHDTGSWSDVVNRMHRIEALVENFSSKKIMVIGDVMLDRYIWGKVSRISPEAPVPVVTVEEQAVYPGGAANVARNLVPFARIVRMVGQVGNDADGDILAGALAEGGIDPAGLVRNDEYDTIAKTRVIAQRQQVVRFDREKITKISGDQVREVCQTFTALARDLDALIIEDYGKGFVTQELADALIPLARKAGLVICVDPNPNNPIQWHGVTSIKPNRSEAYREVGLADHAVERHSDPVEDATLLEVGESLLKRWGTEMVHITLGEHGMMLFERGGAVHHIPTLARDVFDVSGAGDTAIAMFTLALTAGASPAEAAEFSNYASGIVVGKLGTAIVEPDELLEAIRKTNGSGRGRRLHPGGAPSSEPVAG